MNILKIPCVVAMFLYSAVAYAAPQNIEAYGEYMMSTADTLESAKEQAMKEAMRSAVEKAGVYVESYSKVKDMALTEDQIRVVAGNIIKIENKSFTTVASGNTFLIKCAINAVIDTDSIDLQRVMEMKKTQEENVRLMKTVANLQREGDILRQQYQQAQSESEKLKIKNELLTNEMELGNLYKWDYQGENILQEVNAATAEFSNFGKMYPGMSVSEFSSQIERQLYADGWQGQTFVNGARHFTKRIDNDFIEEIQYNPMDNSNAVFFYTPSKLAADKLFKIAFTNLYGLIGAPQRLDVDETESATWIKETQLGKQYTTQIYKFYDGQNYCIRISKWLYNKNAVKHSQFKEAEILSQMSPIKGDWYDEQGNKVLSITEGYINGCKVIGGFDFAGGRGQYGIYRIMENRGPRDITIEKMSPKMIKVDNSTILKSTATESYYESVNGIHLGMASSNVKARLGKPDNIVTNAVRLTWVYTSLGLSMQYENDRVVQIAMQNNGKWFLDKSKLNYRNSISEYCTAYNLSRTPKPLTQLERKQGYIGGGYEIAKGEYLWFGYYPEILILSIFWN